VHTSTESTTSSNVSLVIPTAAPAHQTQHPQGVSSAPSLPLHDANAHASHSTNLLTPAFFAPPPHSSASVAPPVSSVTPTAPPLYTNQASSAQDPSYGTPLFQPFPPPTPPPSLTPAHNDEPVISRDRVKDALRRLVQVSCTLELYSKLKY
jgi:mRNA-decapping enzyme 1B